MNPADILKRIEESIHKAFFGYQEVIRLLLTCLIAEGHVLIEDIPGMGKSLLAQALAKTLGGTFQRIQFTSDMLPADIIGTNIWNPKTREFEFHPGPIFANVVLADELNRTNPKTQSALLEAMSDGQVSIDRKIYPLPKPFFLVATQNPLEFYGTFPLPESQKDRFLMTVHLGYPSPEIEYQIILSPHPADLLSVLEPVVDLKTILELQKMKYSVHVHKDIAKYVLRLLKATREHPAIRLGVSPRGGKYLITAGRAFALLHGRSYVIPEDIKTLCPWVWGHRLVLNPTLEQSQQDEKSILNDILSSVPVPQ